MTPVASSADTYLQKKHAPKSVTSSKASSVSKEKIKSAPSPKSSLQSSQLPEDQQRKSVFSSGSKEAKKEEKARKEELKALAAARKEEEKAAKKAAKKEKGSFFSRLKAKGKRKAEEGGARGRGLEEAAVDVSRRGQEEEEGKDSLAGECMCVCVSFGGRPSPVAPCKLPPSYKC